MNAKQLARCIHRTDRNYMVVADVFVRDGGCPISLKMGGYKSRISHRRVKLTMKAAKAAWPEVSVFFRDGGTLVTAEVAADWQQHNAGHGYWWPKLAKWAARAARVSARINGK